jgi:hypothetical protein
VLDVLLEPDRAELAADAAGLVAAERRGEVARIAVDLQAPRANPARQLLAPLAVGRPDAAAEPVDGVVGDPYGVVLVLVRAAAMPASAPGPCYGVSR